MTTKMWFIPLVFLGVLILSLATIAPVFSATAVLRFYDTDDPYKDQEWARQGGRVGIEVSDSDLNTIVKMEGESAERFSLSAERTIYLINIPVADRNGDGFVNRLDVTIVDASGNILDVDRVGADGRVDLVSPYTGEIRVSYWGYAIASVEASVKSLADPTGFTVPLRESRANSGVFRMVIDTNPTRSDAPSLKVGKDDVITLTYMDADTSQTISKRLNVETTPPTFANISPAHDSSYSANTEVEFDVTDGDSGVDYNDVWIIFAVDQDSDGVVESAYERGVSRGRTIRDGMRVGLQLPDDSEIDMGATIYWWSLAQDGAGNLAMLDRQPSIDGGNDACSPDDFPRTSLVGADVGVTGQISGCQPYAVRIDYAGPFIERILTGSWWDVSKSGEDKTEYDPTKARNDSILMDFSEEMDASTVERFDFEVDGRIPLKAEVFDGRRDYVFLTVPALAPNARPTVEVTGEIRDTSGNRYRAEDSRPTPQPTPAPTQASSISSLDLLVRVLRETVAVGALSDAIASLLSDWFIENLIAPATGETPDEVRKRLSSE